MIITKKLPASSDELRLSCRVSSSLILFTRSCLRHLLNASASFSYVAFALRFCFRCNSIKSPCASTDGGCDSTMSATVRSRKGAISCQFARCRARGLREDTLQNMAVSIWLVDTRPSRRTAVEVRLTSSCSSSKATSFLCG